MDGASRLAEIYAQYGRTVYRRALYLLGEPEAAKDATHEAFLRMMATGGPARFEPTPMGWLYRVTTNLCLNNLRNDKRQEAILQARGVPEEGDGDAHDGRTDARIMVGRILAQVPDDLQEIAIYYYIDDLSHDEISSIVGISRRTVGNRLASFHALTDQLLTKEARS